MMNKNAKLENLEPFAVFSAPARGGFSSKRITLKVDVLKGSKYTVSGRVRASFSPEILHARAAKGVSSQHSVC